MLALSFNNNQATNKHTNARQRMTRKSNQSCTSIHNPNYYYYCSYSYYCYYYCCYYCRYSSCFYCCYFCCYCYCYYYCYYSSYYSSYYSYSYSY